jgi:hypothetical protein
MTYKTRLCSYINTIRLELRKTEEEVPPPEREIVETLSGSNPIALAAATGAAGTEAPTGEVAEGAAAGAAAATTEAPAEKTAATPEKEPAKADTAAKK